LLLDAVAGLGPSLLVLYRHADGDPARRLTLLKGGNEPAGRAPDSLRSVAGSPNRLLTMVHTADGPADVARELAVFLSWRERAALVASAWAAGSVCGRASGARTRVPPGRGEAFAELLRDVDLPDIARRWSAVEQWSHKVPLLNEGPAW
jgi:hypothetical protein